MPNIGSVSHGFGKEQTGLRAHPWAAPVVRWIAWLVESVRHFVVGGQHDWYWEGSMSSDLYSSDLEL